MISPTPTPSTEWERLTVGSLLSWLEGALAEGLITDDTLVCSDSDPEGNGINPLRQAFSLGELKGKHSFDWEDADEDEQGPVSAICIGAGY